jgi:hypothetical protein
MSVFIFTWLIIFVKASFEFFFAFFSSIKIIFKKTQFCFTISHIGSSVTIRRNNLWSFTLVARPN